MSGKKKDELPIYDPEGMLADVTYREVKVTLQDHVTGTRKAVTSTWASFKEEASRVVGDTHKALADTVGQARKKTDSTLSSIGVGTSSQVLRGAAITGGVLVGLFLARRKSVFRLVLYPTFGAGLVGGLIHRDRVMAEYDRLERNYHSHVESWRKAGTGSKR